MSPNPRQLNPGEALNFHRALCELVLEAKITEIEETIRSLGQSPIDLENQAHKAWTTALSESSENVIECKNQFGRYSSPKYNPIQEGFSAFMQLLRRQKGLDIAKLAALAKIDPNEIIKIEEVPGYVPTPRTIFQLERFFSLPRDTLSRLSGAVTKGSDELQGELPKFAACSKGLGKLDAQEKKLLHEFVKYLAKERRLEGEP